MTRSIHTIADFLHPLSPDEFFSRHHGKAPVHIRGEADKIGSVMNWDILTGLLNQSAIWSARSLELVLDTRKLEPHEYCYRGIDRDGRETMLADLDRVARWLRRGASLVCNDIDSLTPGLRAASKALEDALGSKVQANLYCSWQAHQAFDSHFDTHDVYALHIAGEKTWRVYQRHFEDPIAHPAFKTLGQAFHDAHKGPVSMEVTLRPGDVLYIPRGWYHDALASSPGAVHIAFGATSAIGLDLLGMLFERAVHDPLFRRSVPRPDGDNAPLAEHMAALGERLAAFAREPEVIEGFSRFVADYRYQRPALKLPDDALVRRWRRNSSDLRVEPGPKGLQLGNGRRSVPVPRGMEGPVAWIVERESFAEPDFAAAFPSLGEGARRQLLADLASMKVVEPA